MASSKSRLHRLFGIDAAVHDGESAIDQKSNVNLEVISLGLSRTGTTSLGLALQKLGYGLAIKEWYVNLVSSTMYRICLNEMQDLHKRPAHRDAWIAYLTDLNCGALSEQPEVITSCLRTLTAGWRLAGGGPINCLVAESLAAYPNAKFIPKIRVGVDGAQMSWYNSFDAAMDVLFREDRSHKVYRALIWPVSFLRGLDDFMHVYKRKLTNDLGGTYGPGWYHRHNGRVERLIPEKQSLKSSVKERWEPPCKLLGKEVPAEEFPRVNELESMKRHFFMVQVFGLCTWLLHAGLTVAIAYVAVKLNSTYSPK